MASVAARSRSSASWRPQGPRDSLRGHDGGAEILFHLARGPWRRGTSTSTMCPAPPNMATDQARLSRRCRRRRRQKIVFRLLRLRLSNLCRQTRRRCSTCGGDGRSAHDPDGMDGMQAGGECRCGRSDGSTGMLGVVRYYGYGPGSREPRVMPDRQGVREADPFVVWWHRGAGAQMDKSRTSRERPSRSASTTPRGQIGDDGSACGSWKRPSHP